MVTPTGSMLKLCDFGTAFQLSDDKPRAMERIGTLSYTSPEIYSDKGATTLADCWSLGVVLYLLLVGANPFRHSSDATPKETVRRIQAGDFDRDREKWHKLSGPSQDLVCKLLRVEETERLTATSAMRHRWAEGGKPTADSEGEEVAVLAPIVPSLLHLLQRFAELDVLQQMLLAALARLVPEATHPGDSPSPIPWYRLFFFLDADMDGELVLSEAVAGLETLLLASEAPAVSRWQLESFAAALDLDGSGTISWSEWSALARLSDGTSRAFEDALPTLFRSLDAPSGDGLIQAGDLVALLSSEDHAGDIEAALRRWTCAGPWRDELGSAGSGLDLSGLRRLLDIRHEWPEELDSTEEQAIGQVFSVPAVPRVQVQAIMPHVMAADGTLRVQTMPLARPAPPGPQAFDYGFRPQQLSPRGPAPASYVLDPKLLGLAPSPAGERIARDTPRLVASR